MMVSNEASMAYAAGEMKPATPAADIEVRTTDPADVESPVAVSRTRLRWSWQHWAAVLVSSVFGAIIGITAFGADDDPFTAEHGRLFAQGSLHAALTDQISGIIDRDTGIQIGVSFLAKNGDYCRTFTLKHEAALAGLACNRDRRWSVDAVTRMKSDASSAYRMAGAAVPALILGMVEDTIAGDPFDLEQEAEARDRDWSR